MKKIIFLILITFILISCKKEPKEYVAKVNDEYLTIEKLKGFFPESKWDSLSKNEKKKQIQHWIDLTLLSQKADELGICENIEVKNKIEMATKKIKGNVYIAQTLENVNVTDDELFSYYKSHKNEYKKKEKELKIQQIFTKTEAKIDSIQGLIQSGTKFLDAAKLYSEDQYKSIGGYSGFHSQEDLGKNIWNRLIKLNKWVYIKVKTPKGFYLMRWYDQREKDAYKSFDEVKPEIKKIVIQNKKEEIYNKLLKDIRVNMDIKIKNLD